MGDQQLTVRVDDAGPVCSLTFAGELDLPAARGVVAQVMDARRDGAAVVRAHAERLVLDLSGLTFLDCAGARALASVTRMVPAECPVIVRAISPAAARLLDLLSLNLERRPAAVMTGQPEGRTWDLVRRSRALQSQGLQMMGQLIELAEALAMTEEQVADNMAGMAGQRPDWAVRLTRLSEQARRYAASNQRWADASSARLRAAATT